MAQSVYRTMLVVGDNHEELVKKYSLETKCEKHLKYKFQDAAKLRADKLKFIKAILDNKTVEIPERLYQIFRNMYLDTMECDDVEFYYDITNGCEYDPETNDAYTTENPDAQFSNAKCYDKEYRILKEESPLSNPFKLKDGTKAYSAHYNDIDWSKMNMDPDTIEVYKSAWKICVDGVEPKTEWEKNIYNRMSRRQTYFSNFKDINEYIIHNCSFWMYAYLDVNGYSDMNYKISNTKWAGGFFDKFIKPLENDNPLLTIYDIRSLND